MLVNEKSCMRKATHEGQSSTTLFSVVPSTWKTPLRERIHRIRHLCITVDLAGDWRICQGAIAELLEVLKLAENLRDLELVITEPRYASARSRLMLPENAALRPLLRLEYPGMKSSTITMTNIPRHFERSFSKLIQSQGWMGTYIVRKTHSRVTALQR